MHTSYIIAALALALPVYSTSSGNVGCYSDAGSLKNKGPYSYQSPGYCEEVCLRDGHKVAALTRGNMCYCGDTLPSQSAKVDDDKCDQMCIGWPSDSCGGKDTFTVYWITKDDAENNSPENSSTTAAPTAATAATAAGGIIVAPTANSAPSGIVTAPSSMNSKGASAIASKSANAASTAATSATASASPTNNAAGTIQVGSSLIGAVVAGMGLLL
ncbi:hypothetical protein N7467_006205 [Penicillium canescens]|nr:hypothetical protein N7467_006205 [Penicillium canescens]